MSDLINVKEVLFHLLNLIILTVAARFLLYKPVSKFMARRSECYVKEREAIEAAKAENEDFKNRMGSFMAEAREEAEAYLNTQKARAEKEAETYSDRAREAAEREARRIVEDARAERMVELEKHKKEIVLAAVGIARNVLGREIKPQDETKLVEDFIMHIQRDEGEV